jgi:thiamine transport system permease protein
MPSGKAPGLIAVRKRRGNGARQWDGPALCLGLLPVGFMLVFLVLPVVALWSNANTLVAGVQSHESELAAWWALGQDAYLRWRIVWTFMQALVTCAMTLALGVPLAYLLTRVEWPLRSAVARWVMLPFVVPTLVAAMGILAVYGDKGWWASGLQQGPWLLLYGNLFFNLSVVIKAAMEGLHAISAHRIAAARTLGASPWRAFWRVEWPELMPRLTGALCLVFLYSFGGFGLALLLGGQRYVTMEVEIYTLVAHELELAAARRLALISFLGLSLAVGVQAWLSLRLRAPQSHRPVAPIRPRSVGQRAAVGLGLLFLFMVCGLPLLAVGIQAFVALPQLPTLLLEPDTQWALFNTARFSFLALALSTLLGTSLAFAAFHWSSLRLALWLPLMVSPVTIAFGYLVAYPSASASLVLMIGAYTMLAMPLVAQSVLNGLDAMPHNPYLAARSLGASRWRAFWRITLPSLAPALRRGMAFALATCLGEFAVTLFLSRPEWTTLSTLIYQYLGRPGQLNFDAALLLSGLLLALTLGAFRLIEGRPPTRHP